MVYDEKEFPTPGIREDREVRQRIRVEQVSADIRQMMSTTSLTEAGLNKRLEVQSQWENLSSLEGSYTCTRFGLRTETGIRTRRRSSETEEVVGLPVRSTSLGKRW